MEASLEQILERLNSAHTNDPEQEMRELNFILLEKYLNDPEISFCCAKLLNSNISLLNYLKKNSQIKEKQTAFLKKKICELLKDLIKNKSRHLPDYLNQIYDGCFSTFITDASSLVRESALGPITQMLESYSTQDLSNIIKPIKLAGTLLDEMKVHHPSASVKGAIWELVSSLLKIYPSQLADFRLEVQDVMLNQLLEQMRSAKPELRTIVGILKGFGHALDVVALTDSQIGKLYGVIKIAMMPVEEGRSQSVLKAAAKLLTIRAQVFESLIINDAIPLSEEALKLCSHQNLDIREVSNTLLEELTRRFSKGLKEGKAHKDIFIYLIKRYNAILESPTQLLSPLVVTVTRTIEQLTECPDETAMMLVNEGLITSLQVPPAVASGEEDSGISLHRAVALWKGFICAPVWNDIVRKAVYNLIVEFILNSVLELHLEYEAVVDANTSATSYVPSNPEDLQLFIRIVNFAQRLLPKLEVDWFVPWLPLFASELTMRLYELPRISKLYSLLKVALQLGEKGGYFSYNVAESFGLLNSFFKHLAIRQNEFEDELLSFALELLLTVPIPFIYSEKENSLDVYVGLMIKSLSLGVVDTELAYNAVDSLEKWISQIPMKILNPYTKAILPHLSPYLMLSSDKNTKVKPEQNEVSKLLMRQPKKHSAALISKRVLELLGNLGGGCHDVVGDSQISQTSMAWDLYRIIKFSVPLLSIKVDIFLDNLLPRVIELTKTTANWETRTAAIELFHAAVLYTIGRCNELEGKVNFTNIFKQLFPEMLRLASDIQQLPRSIFEPLCRQTVHWLATSTKQESPEVAILLDSLLAGAADKSNATLREHCALCIAEYFDWHIRHIPREQLKENLPTIKSLIRKIQSFAIHPDTFKQLAALLCFDKVLASVRNEQSLSDLYLMDIATSLLSALKLADKSLCETSARHLTDGLTKALKHYKITLMTENDKRAGIKTVKEFTEMLFAKTCESAELCRLAAQQLWVAIANPNPKEWLQIHMNRMTEVRNGIGFTVIEHVVYSHEQAGVYMKAERISAEKLEAQVQCVKWLVKSEFVSWNELPEVLGVTEFTNFGLNVAKFLRMINEYVDVRARELRNVIIRLNVVTFTNLMELFGLLMNESLLLGYLEQLGITKDYFMNTLIIAVTDPEMLDLELGAPERQLTQRFNTLVQETLQKFIKSTIEEQEDILKRINELYQMKRITNPLIGQQLLDIPTNRLIQICIGHLGLYKIIFNNHNSDYIIIPETASHFFTEQKNTLIKCIETLITEANPQNVQKIRIILKYLLHLGVPYIKLEQWLLEHCLLFQRCSEALLDYIVGSWETAGLAKSLVSACKDKKEMFAIMLPVLKRFIATDRMSHIKIFYDVVPMHWNITVQDIDPIINELKIYQIIIGVSRTRLLNDLYSESGKRFLGHCLNRIKVFLKESGSVITKKEALLLAAEAWELKVEGGKTFSEELAADLKEVQKQYFPIKTTDLEKCSKGAVNFEILLDAFINIFAVNLNYSSLCWLFLVLREATSPYMSKIKASLTSYIQKIIGASQQIFKEEIEQIFNLFADPETDMNLYDNLRWAIAKKILLPILENCPEKYLCGFIQTHNSTFIKTLEDKSEFQNKEPAALCLVAFFHGYIYKIYEILYTKVDTETIRTNVHIALYGEDTKGNELTKFLIVNCHGAKRQFLPSYKKLIDWLETQERDVRSSSTNSDGRIITAYSVQGFYSSCAYGCMASVIGKTQSKELLFNQYMFRVGRDKGDILWEALIDTKEIKFEVETSFKVKSIAPRFPLVASSQAVVETFDKYFSDSLFVQYQSVKAVPPVKKQEQKLEEDKTVTFEQDKINSQLVMIYVLRLLDIMQNKFGNDWNNQGDLMPQFMQELRHEISIPEIHVNIKIFILKIVVNKAALFKRFAKDWFEPIMSYVIGSKEQGKGFHYFSRDLCTTVLEWNYVPERNSKTIDLCSNLINSIIKVLPDQTSYIFHMNVRVLGALMERFAKLIYINKKVLTDMMGVANRTDSIDLWRLNAMQILAFASVNDIVLCDSSEKFTTLSIPQFQLAETDPLYRKLLENLVFHRRAVALAAADTIGRVHRRLMSSLHDNTLVNYLIGVVLPRGMGDLAQVCERIMATYPELLNERRLFLKVLGTIPNLSGIARASALVSLNYYLPIARNSKKQGDIEEICGGLQANSKSLIMDNILEHRKALLSLIIGLTQIQLDSVNSLLNAITPLLTTDTYIKNTDDDIRFMICKLMCWLYDNSPSLRKYSRICIVESFADKSERIKKYLANIWDNEERLSNKPSQRLAAIMKNLYVCDGNYLNPNWVGMSLGLLMSLSKRSSDYCRKIYEYPLSKCPFNKLSFDRNNLFFNRSQPLTLLLSSLPDSLTGPKVLERDAGGKEEKKDESIQGIRATQVPIFSPSLEQSLVVCRGNEHHFGESFYQMEERRKEELEGREEEKNVKENKNNEFKVPEVIQTKRVKGHLKKFFNAGTFTYGPQLVEGKIRYNPLGAMINKEESTRNEQERIWRSRTQQTSSMSICREYRVGELPDIEILYMDIIEPLRILAMEDSSIASELFISLFTGIYFTELSEGIKEEITHYLGELLDSQQKHSASYQTIYVLHQVMINLLKEGVNFPLSEMQFAYTEQNALNFQTSILAIEQSILSIQQRATPAIKRAKVAVPKKKANPKIAPGLTVYNSRLWLQLTKLYKQMNNPDYTDGIYSIISEDANVFTTEESKDELVTLLNKAFEEKINLKHSNCVNTTTQILSMAGIEYSIDKELLNSLRKDKYESLERLSRWDDLEQTIAGTRNEIIWQPENRDELATFIRARMRCELTWEKHTEDLQSWLADEHKKVILLNQFSYELALQSMIQQDLDRAAYYIDRELTRIQQRWSSINSMCFGTMHYLVQSVQKIHEFYECLNLLKNGKMKPRVELLDEAVNLCSKWRDRTANVHSDSMKTWDDILYSRCLFLDILNMKFPGLKERLNENEATKDLAALFYIQTAHAAYKKKMFESTDSYLRIALKYRTDPSNTSLALTYPIIKLKAKQHQMEGVLMEPADRISKYLKLIEISNAESSKVKGKSVQLLLLSFRLSQIVAKEYVTGGWFDEYTKCLTTCFDFIHNAEKTSDSSNKAKVHFHFATFCDGVLRQINSEFKECVLEKLNTINLNQIELAISLIKNGLAAINLGHEKGNNLIPRILDILSQMCNHSDVEQTFIHHSTATPAWMFLPWINQFIAIMNNPASKAISAKFREMTEKYPQPIMYALKVADSNRKVDISEPKEGELSELYESAIILMERNKSVSAWIEALDGLTYPEHRTKYWLELMKDAFTSDECKDVKKLEHLLRLCYDDVFTLDKKYIGTKIGTYNKKFNKIFEPAFVKIFGKGKELKVNTMTFKDFYRFLNLMLKKFQDFIQQLGEGPQKLSAFSEWLDEYNANSIADPKDLIEIPGQYKANMEPQPESHVKVASVNKTLLVLGSIRRPKRIELHGTNEKSYYLLVKGGEDLRLDERIQQLFTLMNEIFATDTDCRSRYIRLKQFAVTPMTNRLGTLEWVTDTVPLKKLIVMQLNLDEVNDNKKIPGHVERLKWMNELYPNKNILEQHMALLSLDDAIVVEAFKKHVDATSWKSLRRTIEGMCLSSEAFMAVRERFLKSYAAICVSGYILGIGDRHLENFLVDMKDGEVLAIDFGVSFGNGIQLTVPELTPFRITNQLEGIMAPYSDKGLFGATMTYVISALKDRKELLLDCSEVFVKDPLFDWVKSAKLKQGNDDQHEDVSLLGQQMSGLEWYPRKKIKVMKAKLEGRHPVLIMIDELEESKHGKQGYFRTLKTALINTSEEIALELNRGVTVLNDPSEIARCLIAMARNPNILGRAWIGWAPYL